MDEKTLQEIVAIEVDRLRGGADISAHVLHGVVTLTGVIQGSTRRVLIAHELLRLPGILTVQFDADAMAPPASSPLGAGPVASFGSFPHGTAGRTAT